MSLLYFLSYISVLIQICFATTAVAAGLYYLAELIEEHTLIAKKVISWMIAATAIIYILFILFDDLPWSMIWCGLAAQVFHTLIMKNFPNVEFLSLPFLLAVLFLIINHGLAFQHFSSVHYPFSEVIAYFTLCLWVVPFALFVSLSANDNVLPTVNEQSPLLDNPDVVTNYFSRKGNKLGLLTLFNYLKDLIFPGRSKKSF